MEIESYNASKITLIRASSNPLELVNMACSLTMKKNFKDFKSSKELVKFCLDANHTSIFEHINYTFLIEGATRNFLAQITRHRIASYTSGSQHYQNYKDYGFKISSKNINIKNMEILKMTTDVAMNSYNQLITNGVPHYEARQVLPGGMENNLIITINARSLINFLNLRLCTRNTEEIFLIAKEIKALLETHFPELFKYVGADCLMASCKQGKFSCMKNKKNIKKGVINE